jgi:hypothetical protein
MRNPGNRFHHLCAVVTMGAGLLFIPRQSFAQG